MIQTFLQLQKEIALYTASKFNSEFCWFDIDGDIDPLFKVKVMIFISPFFDTVVLNLVQLNVLWDTWTEQFGIMVSLPWHLNARNLHLLLAL